MARLGRSALGQGTKPRTAPRPRARVPRRGRGRCSPIASLAVSAHGAPSSSRADREKAARRRTMRDYGERGEGWRRRRGGGDVEEEDRVCSETKERSRGTATGDQRTGSSLSGGLRLIAYCRRAWLGRRRLRKTECERRSREPVSSCRGPSPVRGDVPPSVVS